MVLIDTYMKSLPKFVKIEDHKSLIRDTENMAVINTDDIGRQRYREQRAKLLSDKKRLKDLEEQVKILTLAVSKLLGEK